MWMVTVNMEKSYHVEISRKYTIHDAYTIKCEQNQICHKSQNALCNHGHKRQSAYGISKAKI